MMLPNESTICIQDYEKMYHQMHHFLTLSKNSSGGREVDSHDKLNEDVEEGDNEMPIIPLMFIIFVPAWIKMLWLENAIILPFSYKSHLVESERGCSLLCRGDTTSSEASSQKSSSTRQ